MPLRSRTLVNLPQPRMHATGDTCGVRILRQGRESNVDCGMPAEQKETAVTEGEARPLVLELWLSFMSPAPTLPFAAAAAAVLQCQADTFTHERFISCQLPSFPTTGPSKNADPRKPPNQITPGRGGQRDTFTIITK